MKIWSGGKIIPEDAVTVPARDRVFEHGLGLFETLRTWSSRPLLLHRHTERLRRSASALGIPLRDESLPDEAAVDDLLGAIGRAREDVRLRITATGGAPPDSDAVVWMRAFPLPAPPRAGGAIVVWSSFHVGRDEPLARHKTLNYWSRRLAHERAVAEGADEALLTSTDGLVWEGSRTNLFLISGGVLRTPGLDAPIVPGVMRGVVLELAEAVGLERKEGDLPIEEVDRADEMFLTNSVRGIVPVGRTPGRSITAPGAWTARLQAALAEWLGNGERGASVRSRPLG